MPRTTTIVRCPVCEHAAELTGPASDAADALASFGYRLRRLPSGYDGLVCPDCLRRARR